MRIELYRDEDGCLCARLEDGTVVRFGDGNISYTETK